MRAVALLLVALTFAAGAPRAAHAARVHCCCPPAAHARGPRSHAADVATFVRVCPCEARPAPAKPPGAAPALLQARLADDAPPDAIVTWVLPTIAPVAPRVARPRPDAARAPPCAVSLFHQHVALVV